MFTSHFPLLVLTLACPSGECWGEVRFCTHHGGAGNVLVALRAPGTEGCFYCEGS